MRELFHRHTIGIRIDIDRVVVHTHVVSLGRDMHPDTRPPRERHVYHRRQSEDSHSLH
jgi:hypothetical protein